ncbi:signal peptide prediction [Ottowia sp. SB7-C50]|uniref:signal peptide prediction n=1 Tax=Ottowia sp. SB7-C50 TaxID=3081231 RepID=UPI002955C19E|nr:signal peptide prediction [Ottowia sp. SB7-C50]WOP16176.1 signal peptide prediction [Ottowia sp. SB7-C50]
MQHIWRYFWPLPWTLVGLLAAVLAAAAGARWQWRHGALEVHGGLAARGCARLPPACRFEAITLGHVILGLDACCLDQARAHEHVHVRQYERWGPLFVPAYLASSAWQWCRGAPPYRANRFEREAYRLAPMGHLPASDNGAAEMK